jgi:acyl-CoA reductase-like NAD-dependent aldehyde dehydrogenase
MNSADKPTRTRIPVVFEDEPGMTPAIDRAMAAARVAQARWSVTTIAARLELIRELRRLIADHAPRLAEASASARSRPAAESLVSEVLPLAEACRFLEREAKGILAPRRFGRRGRPLWLAGTRAEIRREPFGVILVIGPGNYPLLLPGVQVIQALAAGNAVLLKPGAGGGAAAAAFCELVVRAGFDPRLVARLPESRGAARAAIAARPDKVLFTGSAAAGEDILGQLAPHLIPAAMELSGCDSVIVRRDADLDLVTRAVVFGLRLNAGRTCIAPRRLFVVRPAATELEGRLAQELRRVALPGAGSGGGVPEALRSLLDEAVAGGAHFLAGSETRVPAVLAAVPLSARLLREDVFAPVVSLVTVADDDEAVARSNDCPYALGSSIFARDESAARPLAARLSAGVVTINDLILPTADARLPFGGRARSGFGVTRGAEGLLELTTSKVVTATRGNFRPAFDTPRPGDEQLFHAYLTFAHGRGWTSRGRALLALVRTVLRRRP